MKQNIKVNFCDFYNSFNKEDNQFMRILKKYYFVEISNEPDFLFYSCFGWSHRKYIDKKCIKIFFSNEMVHPDFNVCDYAIGHDYMTFEDRYFRISKYVRKRINVSNDILLNRKFCNFVYSNDSSGNGAEIRQDFCRQLMEYKLVDCPGRVMNNMKGMISSRTGNWRKGKLDFIKNYKFTIAFENISAPGYVTEKLIDPFLVNSIPIYWGDPYITREFNEKSFVNCHGFATFDEVIEQIKYLDTNNKAYLEMIYQPAMLDTYNVKDHDLEKFLLRIIEKGIQPQPKDERHIWSLNSRIDIIFERLEKHIFSHFINTESEKFNDIWNNIKFSLCTEKEKYEHLYQILKKDYISKFIRSLFRLYKKLFYTFFT